MATLILDKKHQKIIDEIPSVNDFHNIYLYFTKSKADRTYISLINSFIGLNDNTLSYWLNITPKTLRSYKNKEDIVLKENIKEHIVLILSLYKHGTEVFGNRENFEKWLTSKNILLDGKSPDEFLNTISGIRFIDNRLTAIEYGENL